MKTNYLRFALLTVVSFLFIGTIYSQTQSGTTYNVTAGHGNGLRFWSSDNYKIHMGYGAEYTYGPVTGYSIKSNMSNTAGRGWTWGKPGVEPVAALNTSGVFQIKGWFKTMSRTVYFGDKQSLYGDNNSALYWRGGHSTITQIILRDKEGLNYGRIYGSGNGVNFGLLDGDGNWSYRAVKDAWTAFYVDNSMKMVIRTDGNVGIGTTNTTGHKLSVNGNIRAKEIKVESGWADYVFNEDYDLPTLEQEKKHINENGHLLGFESEETMEGNINLGEVTKRQQEKIEQLMLHIIAMDEELKALKAELNQK